MIEAMSKQTKQQYTAQFHKGIWDSIKIKLNIKTIAQLPQEINIYKTNMGAPKKMGALVHGAQWFWGEVTSTPSGLTL